MEHGHEDIVTVLLDDDKTAVDSFDWGGRTPLFWAAGQVNISVARLLLDTGRANIEILNCSGWTPWSLAKANGHDEMVALFEKYLRRWRSTPLRANLR